MTNDLSITFFSLKQVIKLELRKFLEKQKSCLLNWLIFLPTLGFVLITLTSILFPAFLIRTVSVLEDNAGINPFETGIWSYPFLITNFIIFGVWFLYFKKRLPSPITKSINFIFNYEISSKLAFFVITIIIGTYVVASVGELFNGQFLPDYYLRSESNLENYDVTRIGDEGLDKHFGYFLTTSSMQLFDNYKVIPFIASIALLVLTYFVTFEISQKRFAGIVAMLIVLQSGVFLFYDTTVPYPNYWVVFYLLSLYLVYKKWPLSPISYVLSVTSKGLTAIFFPMTLFFIYRANVTKQKKIRLAISYGIIVLLGGATIFLMDQSLGPSDVPFTEFNSHDFWTGFAALSSSLRADGLVSLFLLPLTVGLFIASRKGVLHADSIMFFILTMLLLGPLLLAFSDHHNVPYRFVPLIVFFAMGVGVLLSKRG